MWVGGSENDAKNLFRIIFIYFMNHLPIYFICVICYLCTSVTCVQMYSLMSSRKHLENVYMPDFADWEVAPPFQREMQIYNKVH